MVFSVTIVVLLVLFGVTAVALIDVETETRRLEASLRAIGDRWGIARTEGPSVLQGDLDGFRIEVGVGNANRSRCTEIRVSGLQPTGLEIVGRQADLRGASAAGASTGDPRFDAVVEIWRLGADRLDGWPDEEAREILSLAIQRGAALREGVWTLSAGGLVTDEGALEELLRTVVAAARVLARNPTVRDIQRLVTDDPVPGVRQNALEALLRWGAAERSWLVELAASADSPIAVRAAAATGDRARLMNFLRHRTVARDAALALAATCTADQPIPSDVEDVLVTAVFLGDPEVIDTLGRAGTVRALPALRELATRWLGLAGTARRAREAARAIEERASPQRGALALVEDTTGRLSTVDPPSPDDGPRSS